MASHRRL
ncbi:hypothetical protein VTL71DRAFT_1504 [Oculimacula yallundae]